MKPSLFKRIVGRVQWAISEYQYAVSPVNNEGFGALSFKDRLWLIKAVIKGYDINGDGVNGRRGPDRYWDVNGNPVEIVAVALSPSDSEAWLATQDLAKAGDLEPTQVNTAFQYAFTTDPCNIKGKLQLDAQVTVTETPCPLDSCNHWVHKVPGQIVYLGTENGYYEACTAEPTVTVYYWLQ